MALVIGHEENGGAHIIHIPTGKTIDLVVVDFDLDFECAKLEAYGVSKDKTELMLQKGTDIEIAENLKIGISLNWKWKTRVSIAYIQPKREYNVVGVCYPLDLRENLHKQYPNQ